ncbi:hypothetical protein [Actinosynnema sp. NPDC020468]|uniref:hypothetical protein n=1 Tax=Actinosynnema sp. NPDC020468 TaxID=3154488 RepID=UPI00341129B5
MFHRKTHAAVARYLDAVVAALRGAGVGVTSLEVDFSPTSATSARLTAAHLDLRWHEQSGWTTADGLAAPADQSPALVALDVVRTR